MDDNTTTHNSKESKLDDEEPDEVGWVAYGLIYTFGMAIYQLFIVQFVNSPSTISVKMALGLAIGVISIIFVATMQM